jgi:TolA-binding protein
MRLVCLIALVTSLTSCSLNTAKNKYVLAEKLWNDGKYEASVSEFEKVFAKDPNGVLGRQALYRAAMTQAFFLSQYADAVRKFNQFLLVEGETDQAWEAQKNIGIIYFEKLEQYDQAISHYSNLIKNKPAITDAAEFLFRIGKSHFFKWQFAEAVTTFQDVVKKYPKTEWAEQAAYETGVTYYTQGEQTPAEAKAYKTAISSFQQFIKQYPNSKLVPEAHFGIASCFEEMDQLEAAYHAFEALKNTYPSPNVIEIKLARIRDRKSQKVH